VRCRFGGVNSGGARRPSAAQLVPRSTEFASRCRCGGREESAAPVDAARLRARGLEGVLHANADRPYSSNFRNGYWVTRHNRCLAVKADERVERIDGGAPARAPRSGGGGRSRCRSRPTRPSGTYRSDALDNAVFGSALLALLSGREPVSPIPGSRLVDGASRSAGGLWHRYRLRSLACLQPEPHTQIRAAVRRSFLRNARSIPAP
jgi:hypothetical protein